MEVAYWQLFVIGSVVATYFYGSKKTATIVAVGWTVWTVLVINTAPLMALQLVSAWGTWKVCDWFSIKRKKISDLEEILKEYEPQMRERISMMANGPSRKEIISGKKHYAELIDAISTARSEVLILSGWIRSGVIDGKFGELVANALRRGVSIYIGYGWSDSSGHHQQDRTTLAAKRVLEKQAQLGRQEESPGVLYLREFPTHEKLLIKDDDFVIYGSNNWLSNRRFLNRERSLKIFDTNLVKIDGERVRRLVNPRSDN